MGLTYTNPESSLYRPDWVFAKTVGSIGGTIMFIAMLMYFLVLVSTLLKKKTASVALELPVSELYHDEDAPLVQSLRPWLIAAAILLLVAYTAPFVQLAQAKYEGAPPYSPSSPVAQPQP
jgi:hypothetical protein